MRITSGIALWLLMACGPGLVVPAELFAQQKPPQEEPKPDPDAVPDPGNPLEDARRPNGALFGGAAFDTEPANGVRINGSVFEVWDDNLLAEVAAPNAENSLRIGGAYTNLLGDVNYARSTNRVQVAATGGANARYYTNVNKFAANDYHAGIGVAMRPTALTTVTANQSLSYAPLFLFGLFTDALPPGLGSVPSPDSTYAINDDRAVTSESGLKLERRLNPYLTFEGEGSYRRSHFIVASARGTDFSSVNVGGGFRRRISVDADFRLGYFYRQAAFDGFAPSNLAAQQPAEHNLNIGVAFNPVRTEEKRTIFTFEGGTSYVNSAVATNGLETRRQFRVVGDAALAHQMGRTWLLVGAFKRGTGFVQGLSGPVFTDSGSITASGFFNGRTDLRASIGYSTGEPSLVGSIVNFSTTTANLRLRFALTERWALTTEYLFYDYDFSKVRDLAAGLEPRVKRNTLRLGISFWLPVR